MIVSPTNLNSRTSSFQQVEDDKAMGSMQNYHYISWLAGINIYSFSIHMLHGWKDQSRFQRNKRCIFWTSELGVMAILMETVRRLLVAARE